ALREEDFDLDLLGFEDDELAALLAEEEPSEGLTDEDAAPEVPQTPVSIRSDLWILGGHRLLCGDATSSADLQRLLAGEAADLVFTDPPYNVDYEGYTEDRLRIEGDRMSRSSSSSSSVIHFGPTARESNRARLSTCVIPPPGSVSFRMPSNRRASRFAVNWFGRRTRSPGASGVTNSS